MRWARLEGRQIGRTPLGIDRQDVLLDRSRGMSLTDIAKAHRISRATVSRVIKEARDATSPKECVPPPLQTHVNRLPNPAITDLTNQVKVAYPCKSQ
jgi:hypothetical protein